jgi:hypothetical protein
MKRTGLAHALANYAGGFVDQDAHQALSFLCNSKRRTSSISVTVFWLFQR